MRNSIVIFLTLHIMIVNMQKIATFKIVDDLKSITCRNTCIRQLRLFSEPFFKITLFKELFRV